MREFSVRLLGVEVFAVTLGVPEFEYVDGDTTAVSLGLHTQIEGFGFAPEPYYEEEE